MRLDKNEPLTQARLNKIRKYMITEKDRDEMTEMLDDLSDAITQEAHGGRTSEEKRIPTGLMDLASSILYDGRQHVDLLKIERVGHFDVLEEMPEDKINIEIGKLTAGHSLPTDAEQSRFLQALKEEKSIRKHNLSVDKKIADINAESKRINSREAIDKRLHAEQEYSRLRGESTYSMEPQQHEEHFSALIEAAQQAGASAPDISDIYNRQRSEADSIVSNQQRLFNNASLEMRDRYGIKAPDYDVDAAISRSMEWKPSAELVAENKRTASEDAHIEKLREEYNRLQMAGEKQTGFDEDRHRSQFQYENSGSDGAGAGGDKSRADMSLQEIANLAPSSQQ